MAKSGVKWLQLALRALPLQERNSWIFSGMFVRMAFKAAREYPKECKETRLDIDRRVRKAIQEWM